jgi:Fe(3+) dicitrate transport protein
MGTNVFRSPLIATAVVLALANPGVGTAENSAGAVTSDLPRVDVIGTREHLATLAGSGDLISAEQLARSLPFTANEALRKAPGVVARDEEGFGLRPNIGIRGLNPTRSTKVTLLEDGLPLAYAPYGDNASYYHPPIDRFGSIEVLKGADSLAFGPQTIGGVINYVTPEPPARFGGLVQLGGGTRGYSNAHLRLGDAGWLIDYVRKEGDGARDNLAHELNDLNAKYVQALGAHHALTLRANAYEEDSNVTYSGLTQAEFERRGARYNPFDNDEFSTRRFGASVTHQWQGAGALSITSSAWWSRFDRDWWRQSSTTTDGQCGAAFTAARLAGDVVDPDGCNSAQGRLRSYDQYGIEPRLRFAHAWGELQAGAKLHFEEQERRQVNATSPTGRTGTQVENNLRKTEAQSAFIAHRFELGSLAITPVLRHERVQADRTNRLNPLQTGTTRVTETLPGIGLTWKPGRQITLFTSLHEGFAPPRVEDLVGGTGTVTDVDPEKSANFEIGVRAMALAGLDLQLAYFRNDYDNLIAVGSIAGGSTPLSQGEALFSGVEFGARYAHTSGLFASLALTWLEQAEQSSAFENVATGAVVGVAGNRQPYAPRTTATAAVGFAAARFDVQTEVQYVGAQFSDFANTVTPTADGQRGRIGSSTVFNLAANYRLDDSWSGFAAVKNLADRTYIVDRTRGIQVGQGRLVHAGVRLQF